MTTPEAQLEFLTKLQRLFTEGDFTATYKFALLISLADICVEQGQDNADAMVVQHKDIALLTDIAGDRLPGMGIGGCRSGPKQAFPQGSRL